jgi:hypothetical protein
MRISVAFMVLALSIGEDADGSRAAQYHIGYLAEDMISFFISSFNVHC